MKSWIPDFIEDDDSLLKNNVALLTSSRLDARKKALPMQIFRDLLISITFLSACFFAAFAFSTEQRSSTSSGTTSPKTTTLPPVNYSQEVPLWPENSHILLEGIKALANEKNAITHPSFLIYSPVGNAAHPAVLVFPGGGFKALAIGQDSTLGYLGTDVCKWLNDSGIVCFLVKYRVPNTGCNWNNKTNRHETPAIPMALQDTQRAISMVRSRAKEYGIDPNKIGVMGFSAGGALAVLASTAFKKRSYRAIDDIDLVSSRPDFAIPVYPGHLTMEHKNKIPTELAAQQLNTDIEISTEIPPTLLIHAKDDPVDPVYYSQVYERELKKANINVTRIVYETGGHAFGVSKQGKDTDRWTEDAIQWLRRIGVLR